MVWKKTVATTGWGGGEDGEGGGMGRGGRWGGGGGKPIFQVNSQHILIKFLPIN